MRSKSLIAQVRRRRPVVLASLAVLLAGTFASEATYLFAADASQTAKPVEGHRSATARPVRTTTTRVRRTTTTTSSSSTTTTLPQKPSSKIAYLLVGSDGGIFTFGGAGFYGSMGGQVLNKPVIGLAATADGKGYWLVASDGGIFNFGDAGFYGSMGGQVLNKPVVGLAATADGKGYWMVASDGGIFNFGDAGFYGSMGGQVLNKPIVGMAATADGKGYWLVASDGGLFNFGDAGFYGSMGGQVLNKPIVGLCAVSDGLGYWMISADGGIFSFGSARTHFFGSLGGRPLTHPIIAMSSLTTNQGYWMSDSNGAISNFGTAFYWGSAPQKLNAPIVAMVSTKGTGRATASSFQSGSYGYDISKWQCGQFPPSPYQIGVVEVEGWMFTTTSQPTKVNTTNPCLATEMNWAGGGLNLYDFMNFGNAPSSADGNCAALYTPQACNFGYNHALASYQKALSTHLNVKVTWWLDVETGGFNPTNHGTTPKKNASEAQGAVDALRGQGINTVGFYASVLKWKTLLGNYNPSGPLWVAWWTSATPSILCSSAKSFASGRGKTLPPDPIVLLQYTDNRGGYDGDYAC